MLGSRATPPINVEVAMFADLARLPFGADGNGSKSRSSKEYAYMKSEPGRQIDNQNLGDCTGVLSLGGYDARLGLGFGGSPG